MRRRSRWIDLTAAVAVAAALGGCGVKAPPRPPLREPPADPAAAAPPSGTAPAAPSEPSR